MSILYICATPIGNLQDITLRALEVLAQADIILCEDTRLSKTLLNLHNINYKKLVALHEHNENEISHKVLDWLTDGLIIVQISDAGTPGISDPGNRLCNIVRDAGFKVVPLPGACAFISLLSVAGIISPSLFYGFLPSKAGARKNILNSWQDVNYTVAIYEAPHRILECIKDITECLGGARDIVFGRELTKQFETIVKLKAQQLLEFVGNDTNQQRGEIVMLICPMPQQKNNTATVLSNEQINVLKLLLQELPPKKAVNITHKLTNANKDLLYRYAIAV